MPRRPDKLAILDDDLKAKSANLLAEGERALAERRFDSAFALLDQAVQADPDNWLANKRLGILMTNSQLRDRANHLMLQARRLAPAPDAELDMELGASLHHCGFWPQAAAVYRDHLANFPHNLEAYPWLALNLHLSGQCAEASALMRRVHEVTVEGRPAAARGSAMLGPRYLTGFAGEMITRLGAVSMARQFGWGRFPRHLVVDATIPPCNPHLLDQWRRHIHLCRNEEELAGHRRNGFIINTEFLPVSEGRFVWVMMAWAMGLFERKRRGLGPLLTLSAEDGAFARRELARLGMPEDSWFVAFHCRTAGFHNGPIQDDPLNTEIADYLPAMEEVLRRGGWVVRVGNASMPALPPIRGIIDYVHSDALSPRMDMAIPALARLAVASHSGWGNIPQAFGVPVLWSNYVPLLGMGAGPDDRIIFKRYVDNNGRELDFASQLRPPLLGQRMTFSLREQGLDVRACTPDEIREGVAEMLDSKGPFDADHPLACAFRRASGQDWAVGLDQPSLTWLERYRHLLPA